MGGQKRGLDTSPWPSVSTKRKNTSLKCSLFYPQVSPELALKSEGTAERQQVEPNYSEEIFPSSSAWKYEELSNRTQLSQRN